MEARGKGPLAVVHTGELPGQTAAWRKVERCGGARGQDLAENDCVQCAFLCLPIWLFLGPQVSSGNMSVTKGQTPKSLVAMGRRKALGICLKACQERVVSGDQGRDAAYHLIRKALVKGLWLKKLQSHFPLC